MRDICTQIFGIYTVLDALESVDVLNENEVQEDLLGNFFLTVTVNLRRRTDTETRAHLYNICYVLYLFLCYYCCCCFRRKIKYALIESIACLSNLCCGESAQCYL